MKEYARYTGDGGKRAYRETLIFELINTVDDNLTPDASLEDESYTKTPLTLEQKKRLRNQVYRNALEAVNDYNDALRADQAEGNRTNEQPKTVNDTDVLVDAFFETEYGRNYASQKSVWEEGGEYRAKYEPIIHDWTDGKSSQDVLRWTVSPYDPMFAESSLFSGDNDDIGYMVGSLDDAGNPKKGTFPQKGQTNPLPSGKTAAFVKNADGQVLVYSNGDAILNMKALHLGQNHEIRPASEMAEIIKTPAYDVESDMELSGYATVRRYIKDRQSAKAVSDLLSKQLEEYGAPTQDELDFMSGVCKYLTEKGVDFNVEIDRRDKKLVARVTDGPKTLIRLMDREEPQYQGRIYADNMVSYLSKSRQNADFEITNSDRMAMVRWYFGDSVPVDTSDFASQYQVGRFNVGESAVVNHMSLGSGRGARKNPNLSNMQLTKRSYGRAWGSSSSDNSKSSITVSLKKVINDDTARSGRKYENMEYVNIMTYSSASPYTASDNVAFADTMIFNDSQFEKPESWEEKVKPLIPVDKAYETDVHTDENGNLVMNDSVPEEHYDYYRHLIVRENLASWHANALDNYNKLVDLDGIIEAYDKSQEIPDYSYDFSSDDDIARLQTVYWDVMRGETKRLSQSNDPEVIGLLEDCGTTRDSRIEAIRNHYANHIANKFGTVPELTRPGVPVQNMSRGFRPSSVAKYVNNADSVNIQRNYDYIKHMMLRLGSDYDSSFIMEGEHADDEMKNDLLRFDANNVVASFRYGEIIDPSSRRIVKSKADTKLASLDNMPVTKGMLIHTAKSLAESGCAPESIRVAIDSNGIIHYSGVQQTQKTGVNSYDPNTQYSTSFSNRDSQFVKIEGDIGQIFEPDRYGAIHPKYAVPDGKVLIPGYDAYVVPNDPDDPKPVRDRLRLTGWEQSMRTAISKQIRTAAFSPTRDYNFLPHTTDLNYVYRHAYDTVLEEEIYREKLPRNSSHPTPEERTFLNVIETLKGRCRFPNEYGEGATTMTQSMLEHPDRDEARDYDYYYSDLVDNHNLRVLGTYFDGVFDENMTATAKNQGIVRYLVRGAKVNPDTGEVESAPRGRGHRKPQCALMADPLFDNKYFDTWDRRLMASTQVLTALHTPRHVGVAMMNMKGWNFDDGFLVSKKFAEEYKIHSKEGGLRPLMAQDKLSDMHGNKGVISKVIDPDLATDELVQRIAIDRTVDTSGLNFGDAELSETDVIFNGQTYHVTFDKNSEESHEVQAAHQIQDVFGVRGMDDIMHAFRDNPDMEVVMAPYSTMSRFNGGSIRTLMNEPEDLVLDGKTYKGALGYTDLVVVDMPADVKTHFYTEEAIASGQGRKASSQLAWVLQSKGADAIMKEFYGKNGAAVDNLREYAIALGLDFDVDMKPVVGYRPQTDRGEKRALLKLVDEAALNEINLNETVLNKSGKVVLDKNTDAALRKAMLEKLNETGGFMELPFQLEFKTKSYTNNSSTVIDDKWFTLPETGQTYSVDGKMHPTYGMPVLPQNLRSGQEFQDGTARAHEYTTKYLDIYRNAITYMVCEKALATETDEQRRQLFMDKMEECQTSAQAKFDEVTSDIADNKFNTKHNVVRDEVMATRIGHSATAVWSADPRLDIDQVSMSFEHAEQLGLVGKDGKLVKEASVLVWRDPILHDGNVRYMSVKIDDSINGVAINPLMDQSFDGDFDGDSVAIVPLKTPEARAQAYTLFSVETNMLNKGAVDKNGNYPIYCQSGLDVASNAYDNPKIKTKFNELTIKINALEEKAARLRLNPNDAELGNSIVDMLPEEARTVKNGNRRTPEASINYLRKQYKKELNDWAHMALDGTATDYVDFTDEKSVMRSLQHIVDTGAKGSQSKLKDAADNMGITYQLGTDGRVDLDTVGVLRDKRGHACSLDTYLGTQREKDEKIEETAAYKADNTSQGGLIAQQGVAAFRDMDLQAALELTYPVTQAILQSKHDPKDAKVKDEIVRFWGKDCWNGYKLTGDWTVTDPIELQTQAHQRVTEFVLDPNGEKIPLKERRTYIDDEGKEKVEYVPKVDRYGEPMYEQTYVKCTKDEWIAQMKGMFNAFKVDINPEYIDRLADRMTRDKDAPVTSVNDSVVFYSVQEGGRYTQKPVMGGNGTVVGLTDFAREKGTLLDSVAYFDRLTAVFNEALKTDERYVEAVSKTRNAYTLADSQPRSILTDGIEQGVKAKPLEMELETLKRATTDEEKARRDELRAEIKAIRSQTSISSTFISNNVVNERYGDIQRAETHSDVNTFTKVRKNGEVVEYTTEPKPIGRKDSRLTSERYSAGETFMGESDVEYKSRLALIRGNEPVVEPEAVPKTEAVATATVAAEEPTTPSVGEIEFVQESAKAAKPLNRDAAVTNSIGGTVSAVKANEAKKSEDQLGNGELPPGNS